MLLTRIHTHVNLIYVYIGLVHPSSVQHRIGRYFAFRSRVHRTVFHHVGYVAPSGVYIVNSNIFKFITRKFHFWNISCIDLLRLRVSVCGADHLGDDVCGDHHRHVLLPALQRGLPLVVALLPLCRVQRLVHYCYSYSYTFPIILIRSSGLYLFLYSMWYFVSKLNITGLVPTVLYFAYMTMISLTFFVLTGSIGFFACLWFVRRIYGAIKVDWRSHLLLDGVESASFLEKCCNRRAAEGVFVWLVEK